MTEILTSNHQNSAAIPNLKVSQAEQGNYHLRQNNGAYHNGNGGSRKNSAEDLSCTENQSRTATRFEAFVMTGDKMIRFNPKISPKFAALKQTEISKHAQICDESFSSNSPFSFRQDFYADYPTAKIGQGRRQRAEVDRNLSVDETLIIHTSRENFVSQSENAINQENMQINGSSEAIHNRKQDQNSSVFTIQGRLPVLENYHVRDHRMDSNISDFPVPDTPVYLSVPASPVFPPSNFAHQSSAAFSYSQNFDKSSILDDVQQQTSAKNGPKIAKNGQSFDSNNSLLSNFQAASTSSSVFIDDVTEREKNLHKNLVEKLRAREKEDHQNLENGQKLSENNNGKSNSDQNLDLHDSKVIPRIKQNNQMTSGTKVDSESAKILAKRLYNLDGFRKSDVARHLAKNNEFGKAVLNAYIHLFDFDGLRIDESIRILLSKFCLIGETFERERILVAFSKRYYECNSSSFKSPDEVHALSCALLLLNTDLHGKSVKKRMKFSEFSKNISHLGYNYSEHLLKALFHAVKRKPIEFATDEPIASLSKNMVSTETLTKFLDKDYQVVYKRGWVLRKCVTEDSGKSTPFGRRTWRMFYATIKGPILYLHQDEFGFKKGSFLTLRNAVKLFHAFAKVAGDYVKKQHVFRLLTSSGAEYLFQAADPSQMKEWIEEANFAAARYSAPCLPAPIGSYAPISTSLSRRFSLPKHRTTNTYDQQIKAYELRLNEVQAELAVYHQNLPSRQAKSKTLKIYAENEIYLLMEIDRYSTYVRLLKERQSTHSDNKDQSITGSQNGSTQNLAAKLSGSKPILGNLMESSVEETLPSDDQEQFQGQLESRDYQCSQKNGFLSTNLHKSGNSVDESTNSDRSSYKAAVGNSMSAKEESL